MIHKLNTICLLAIAAFFLAAAAADAKIIYVDADAAGANDGSSWQNAYTFLQDALADTDSAEKPVEIRVAQGIYKPNQRTLQTSNDGDNTFTLINEVTLKGGYAGFGEPDPNSRDIQLFQTILSGDLNGDDVDVNDPCDLRDEPTRSDNSLSVVTSRYNDPNAVLDGFTITGGRDWSTTFGGKTGGAGMYIYHGNPMVLNCTLTGNAAREAGGGMFNVGSNPTLINCTFRKNYADSGAGMYNGLVSPLTSSEGSDPTLINCTFNDNYADTRGGGMYSSDSDPNLANCTFSHNRANGPGGGMYNRHSNPVLADCQFGENTGESGGGMCNVSNSSLMLTNCAFRDNVAEVRGGAIYDGGTEDLMFVNCMFSGNLAQIEGGAIYNRKNCLALIDCIFAGNKAYGDTPYISKGGGLYAFGNALLTNCVFCSNWAQQGRAISQYNLSELRLTNCILCDAGNEVFQKSGPEPDIVYSNIQGGWEGDGNIDADPLFADPGHWASVNDPDIVVEPNHPNAVWVDGDYHLKSQAGRYDPTSGSWVRDDVTSPCIDAGDPHSPIGHEPFPNGGVINMGAYGGTAGASKSYFGEPVCETIVAGDINGDCKVDFRDFVIMAYHWLEDGYP